MATRDRVRELARRLWREHATPWRLAVAVSVGIVVGCSPFYGLHLWIGLALALLFRLNKVAVFLGSQISIPPVAPLLGFASVQLGALIRTGAWLQLTLDDFHLTRLPHLLRQFLLDWLVGGLLVGVTLGAVALPLTVALVSRRRGRDPSTREQERRWRDDLRRAAACYRITHRPHRFYAYFKYRMDPLYRQVSELIGDRLQVVDLGTGLGQLPVLLACRGQGERIVGVDWDDAKIQSGRLASAHLPRVELIVRDIRDFPLTPESADAVVLADVLHYWPADEQRSMLRRAAQGLRPGGRLIVRETDRQARSWLTRLLEAIAVRVGWNRGPGLTFRSADEIRAELEHLELCCSSADASSSTHRGNILLWGEKGPSPSRRGE